MELEEIERIDAEVLAASVDKRLEVLFGVTLGGMGVQAAAVIAAAMCVPLVLRARAGGPRVLAACIWLAGLGGVLVGASVDRAAAVGAIVPAAIVVIVWAIRPWAGLRRRVPVGTSATLRGPIV